MYPVIRLLCGRQIFPFRPNPDGRTVYENVYAWNKAAHMLYIDSPRNVGFSFGEDTKDSAYSDTKARVIHSKMHVRLTLQVA